MNCSEMIEHLKKYPKDKAVKDNGMIRIIETDMPEVNNVGYLKEVDFNTLKIKGEKRLYSYC